MEQPQTMSYGGYFGERLIKSCQANGCNSQRCTRYILNSGRDLTIVRVIYLCDNCYQGGILTNKQKNYALATYSIPELGVRVGHGRYVDL